mgnify:CR=1 FL=1
MFIRQAFLTTLFLCSCSLKKPLKTYITHLNSKEIGDNIIQKLQAQKIDTIIGLYEGCHGCAPGADDPYYIIWKENSKTYATKVTTYTTFNKHNLSYFPFGHFESNFEKIANEKLIEANKWHHYSFDLVTLIIGTQKIIFEICEDTKKINQNALRVISIDKIRSNFFSIEPWEWKGNNYKANSQK